MACTTQRCTAPPGPVCLSNEQSRVYQEPGECRSDGCAYPSTDVTCTFGCDPDTGRCEREPCKGVACQSPPEPSACWQSQGQCLAGVCLYEPIDGVSCNDNNPCTQADACVQGECSGVHKRCDSPPPNDCADATTRRTYTSAGSCNPNDGTCNYEPILSDCAFGCLDGVCQADPCAGVVCNQPPGNCYETLGTCLGGQCIYDPLSNTPCQVPGATQCQQGTCAQGACLPDAGVTCRTEIDTDLCSRAEVPGICTTAGECIPSSPPISTCGAIDCSGICAECTIFDGLSIELCIPLFGN